MADEKEYEQREKRGFKMQKCPVCDKKILADSKFCSECGWDLTDHALTPPQMARIQEEIQEARFRAMEWHVAAVPFAAVGLVCILVAMFAVWEVIPARWDFMLYIGLAFVYIVIAFAFFRDRYKKKQDRLKTILRDRQPSQ